MEVLSVWHERQTLKPPAVHWPESMWSVSLPRGDMGPSLESPVSLSEGLLLSSGWGSGGKGSQGGRDRCR